MITKELISRINELSQKQKLSSLNEEEKQEQSLLRQQYLDGIKAQVRSQIETTISETKPMGHCDCGCNGKHRH